MSFESVVGTAVLSGMLAGAIPAHAQVGGTSHKGSLLIFPRLQVGTASSGVDSLITITHDSSYSVLVKCYYATSVAMPTPYSGSAANARELKHFANFSLRLTPHQVGIIEHGDASGNSWATHLIGTGSAPGVVLYDVTTGPR